VSLRERSSGRAKVRIVYKVKIRSPLLSQSSLARQLILEGLISDDFIAKSGVLVRGKNKFRIIDINDNSYIEVSVENSAITIRYTEPISEQLKSLLQHIKKYVYSLVDYCQIILLEHVAEHGRVLLCTSSKASLSSRIYREISPIFERCLFRKVAEGRFCKSYSVNVADVHIFQDLVYLSQMLKTKSVLLCVRTCRGDIIIVQDIVGAWRAAKLLCSR